MNIIATRLVFLHFVSFSSKTKFFISVDLHSINRDNYECFLHVINNCALKFCTRTLCYFIPTKTVAICACISAILQYAIQTITLKLYSDLNFH